MDQYNQISHRANDNKNRAYQMVSDIESHLRDCKRKIDDLNRSLDDAKRRQNSEAQGGGNPRQFDGQIRNIENEIRRERGHYDHMKREKDKANDFYHISLRNYTEISAASRETILYHIDHLDRLSRIMPPPPPPFRY